MNIFETIFLGFIQGVAEFLPISSSGHLAILKNVFGLSEIGLVYDVLLHLGTLLAVFVAFWKDIKKLIVNGVMLIIEVIINVVYFFINIFSKNKKIYKKILSTQYRRFVLLVIVSTIPTRYNRLSDFGYG